MKNHLLLVPIALALGLTPQAFAAPAVTSASGAAPADIQAAVDQFRTSVSLGGVLNAPGTGPFTDGRREINWDGVPDTAADPNPLPGDFFNATSLRGAVLTTPGTGLLVSANDSNPTATPVRFSSINAAYLTEFQVFSPQRLFAAAGSTTVDVTFFVPTSATTPATVNGFGAVFTDVDDPAASTIEYFDVQGHSLGSFAVPSSTSGGLSFLGVVFDHERVARVRLTSGNLPLGPLNTDSATTDVAAMDDFLYGEPQSDSDADGVPDNVDACLGTATGEVVNGEGCSIDQLVPCEGPRPGGTWRNHGQYVSAVAHAATQFVRLHLISRADRGHIVSDAAHSSCGHKDHGNNGHGNDGHGNDGHGNNGHGHH